MPFRKAYLGSIVDRVEVDDHEIRIIGRKDVLEQAVQATGGLCRVFAVFFANGAPGRIRTHDPQIRSLVFYLLGTSTVVRYKWLRVPATISLAQ